MQYSVLRYACLGLGLLPSLLWAHGATTLAAATDTRPAAQVGAGLSLSLYSAGASDANGLWRIPGVLMGGDALPVERGASLEDAYIWGRYRISPSSSVHAKVTSHADSGGHSSINLESLYLDYQWQRSQAVSAAFGLMGSALTLSTRGQAPQRAFAEQTLIADAFWGGTLHDTALRLQWQPVAAIKLGTELRDGDFFPASSGSGAQALYVQTEQQLAGWALQGGAWAMHARALQRGDSRYLESGHSHGVTAELPVDVRFSGDNQLTGLWFSADAPQWQGLRFSVDYEAVRARSEGRLLDTSREASYSADHLGYALSPSVAYGPLQLSYRQERLSLDNRLTGAGAAVLAQEANLINSRQPRRDSVQLHWQASPKVGWRAAYVRDRSVQDDQRFSVGLVWQDELYHRD